MKTKIKGLKMKKSVFFIIVALAAPAFKATAGVQLQATTNNLVTAGPTVKTAAMTAAINGPALIGATTPVIAPASTTAATLNIGKPSTYAVAASTNRAGQHAVAVSDNQANIGHASHSFTANKNDAVSADHTVAGHHKLGVSGHHVDKDSVGHEGENSKHNHHHNVSKEDKKDAKKELRKAKKDLKKEENHDRGDHGKKLKDRGNDAEERHNKKHNS